MIERVLTRAEYLRNDPMMSFPVHKAGMMLFHDDHKTNYQTAGDWITEQKDNYDWESDGAKQRAIDTDSIWTLTWYPATPIGSYSIAAPTFEELLNFANAHEAPTKP
jgi:hypothetical protein